MTETNMIPEILKQALKTKGMTQKELGDAIGIDPHVISYYVNGRRVPQAKNLMLIAKGLGVSIEYLLGENKRGKWWKVPMTLKNQPKYPNFVYMMYRCSECKKVYESKTNYCPNCGADMERKEE